MQKFEHGDNQMGGERYNIEEKVVTFFKTSSIPEITIGKLKNNIKNDYFPDKDQYNYDRAFFRAFNKLLDSEIIEVVRYDSDVKRSPIQEFNFEPIFVKYSERLTRPDIKDLLNKMNDDNTSYEKIRGRFMKKLEESDVFGQVMRDYLFSRVFSASPDEIWEMVSGNENLKDIYDIYDDLNDEEKKKLLYFGKDDYWVLRNKDLFSKFEKKGKPLHTGFRCSVGALFSLIAKYNGENVKIWFYPLSPERFNSNMELYPTETEKLIEIYSREDLQDDYFNLYFFNIVDKKGEWNKHDAIYKNEYKPFGTFRSPDTAFEYAIDIIFSYPEDQKRAIMEILAKALSDEPGSLQLFMEFYRSIETVNYRDRLLKIFGVFSRNLDKDPIERLAIAIERFNSREETRDLKNNIEKNILASWNTKEK
jgi:hypothetical protein